VEIEVQLKTILKHSSRITLCIPLFQYVQYPKQYGFNDSHSFNILFICSCSLSDKHVETLDPVP
jgi:hypothetical protein